MPAVGANLGRPLLERSRLVRIVISDLIDLVGEISEKEALYDQLSRPPDRRRPAHILFTGIFGNFCRGQTQTVDGNESTHRHWLHRPYQAKEHHQGRASCYSIQISGYPPKHTLASQYQKPRYPQWRSEHSDPQRGSILPQWRHYNPG